MHRRFNATGIEIHSANLPTNGPDAWTKNTAFARTGVSVIQACPQFARPESNQCCSACESDDNAEEYPVQERLINGHNNRLLSTYQY